ncbi:MAG: 2-phospho-L-lactate transferase [Acidimicrobiales bacterium]
MTDALFRVWRVICVLAGGVGAAKLLRGFELLGLNEEVVAIVNTGDDDEFYGLHISPDLDSVTYALAGLSNDELGWGVRDESYRAMEMLGRLGDDAWFTLGDRDLGTHLYRTRRLQEGAHLSEVADEIRLAHGIRTSIVPMSDTPVRTMVRVTTTPESADEMTLRFQEYFVKHRHQPWVRSVSYEGAEGAHVPERAIIALQQARLVVIAPSNPVLSIGPLLAINEIRTRLVERRDSVVAVSPLIGDHALKGPADANLRALFHESTSATVASFYLELCRHILIDPRDAPAANVIQALGVDVHTTPTIMQSDDDKIALARWLAEHR